MICPRCGATHDYLYDNTGGKGQYLCKVCKCTFNKKNRYFKNLLFLCPHCGKALELKKERKDINVHKCTNPKCHYYLDNLNSMSEEDRQRYKSSPHDFKLHYIYREFDIDFVPLAKRSYERPSVDLSRLCVSPHTLGLILTYYVNFGKSSSAENSQFSEPSVPDVISRLRRQIVGCEYYRRLLLRRINASGQGVREVIAGGYKDCLTA